MLQIANLFQSKRAVYGGLWGFLALSVVGIPMIMRRRRIRQAQEAAALNSGPKCDAWFTATLSFAAELDKKHYVPLTPTYYSTQLAVVPIRIEGDSDCQCFLAIEEMIPAQVAELNTDKQAHRFFRQIVSDISGTEEMKSLGPFTSTQHSKQESAIIATTKFVEGASHVFVTLVVIAKDFNKLQKHYQNVAPHVVLSPGGSPTSTAVSKRRASSIIAELSECQVKVTAPATWRLKELTPEKVAFEEFAATEDPKVQYSCKTKIVDQGVVQQCFGCGPTSPTSPNSPHSGRRAQDLEATEKLAAQWGVPLEDCSIQFLYNQSAVNFASASYDNPTFGVRFAIVPGSEIIEPKLCPTATLIYRFPQGKLSGWQLTLQKWTDAPSDFYNSTDEERFTHTVTLLFAHYAQFVEKAAGSSSKVTLASKVEISRFAGLRCAVFDETWENAKVNNGEKVVCRTFVVPLGTGTERTNVTLIVRWEAEGDFQKNTVQLAKFLDTFLLFGC